MIPAMVRWKVDEKDPALLVADDFESRGGSPAPNLPIMGFRLLKHVDGGWICRVPLPKQYPDRVYGDVFVSDGVISLALTTSYTIRGLVGSPVLWHSTEQGYLLGGLYASAPPSVVTTGAAQGWPSELMTATWSDAKNRAAEMFRQAYWRRLCKLAPTKRDLGDMLGLEDPQMLFRQLRKWGLSDVMPPDASRKPKRA